MFAQLLSDDMLDRIRRWAELKRWERREIGQELRRIGLTYSEIALVIPVGKGTLSGWCRDLKLTPDQELRLRTGPGRVAAGRRRGIARRQSALERAQAIRKAARDEARTLRLDPFWVAGTVAYWSEGSKRSKDVKFSNSDPEMIRLFLPWSCRYLDITPERFTIMLHLHAGQDEAETYAFWSKRTQLPPEQFGKSFIKPEGTGHRKNRLYNGTAQIRVRRSSALLHRVLGWVDGLREAFVYAG